MPTLSDARFDALRAQGFTGATSDMLLQWLQDNSGGTPPLDEYVNPELAGGADSGPGENNPPTDHGLGFRTAIGQPQDNGDGTFNWLFNGDQGGGRCFLQYNIQDNNTDLNVGDTITFAYQVFHHPSVDPDNYGAALSVTNQTGCDISNYVRGSVNGQWASVGVTLTITDPVYTAQVRVGTGTTSGVNYTLEVSANPTAVVKRAGVIDLPRTVPDGWKAMLLNLLAADEESYHRNDYWYELLGQLGYDGSLNDRELAFWVAGGDPTTPNPFLLVTDADEPLITDSGQILEAR